MLQYLAVRLFYECELVEQTCQNEIKKEGNFDTIVSFEENKSKESPSIENEKLEAAWKLICLADALGIGKHTILEASPKKLENLPFLSSINSFNFPKFSLSRLAFSILKS